MGGVMSNKRKISIKVLVHKVEQRVVYVVADHNFVDVLFSFMTLPMATIVRLLGKQQDYKSFEALGSFKNLYHSLKDLPECYFTSEECKCMLLNPRSPPSYGLYRKLKLNIDDTEPAKYFVCGDRYCTNKFHGFSSSSNDRCYCGKLMSREIPFKEDDCVDGVFVSDSATFVVTDDLRVMPYTPGCCIQLLKNLGITDMGYLEERTIDIGRDEMLQLLKLAFCVSFPLTYLLLRTTLSIPFTHYTGQGNVGLSIKKEGCSTSSKIFLDVSLQKSTGKLLFAEAREDFLELVFEFLSVSLGNVTRLLENRTSMVCIENIYRSISNMSVGSCLKSDSIKAYLLNPCFSQRFISTNRLITFNGQQFQPQLYFHFPYEFVTNPWDGSFVSSKPNGTKGAELKHPRIRGNPLMKYGTFVVDDDLNIIPSSSISTMEILKKVNVPLNDIEKHRIGIGSEEGLRMLKASLMGFSALTIGLERQLKKYQKS